MLEQQRYCEGKNDQSLTASIVTKVSQFSLSCCWAYFHDLLPQLQIRWHQRQKRPLPVAVKYTCTSIWKHLDCGSTLETLFRKLESLQDDAPQGRIGWQALRCHRPINTIASTSGFAFNPLAHDTNFLADLLSISPCLDLVDSQAAGFTTLVFCALEKLVDFITRIKSMQRLKLSNLIPTTRSETVWLLQNRWQKPATVTVARQSP